MSLSSSLSKILIIDFGSQFTQLIARRIREFGVFSEIVSHKKINSSEIIKKNVSGIILSGGPLNVYENHKFNFDKKILKLGLPILGICFGHQILSKELGGRVKKSKHREFGLATIVKISNSILTKNFFNKKNTSDVWMSHADQVSKMPKKFKIVASTKNSKLTIIENAKDNFYGVQFHPEVTHTSKGKILLRNFLFLVCKVKKNWSSKDQKLKLIKEIKDQVGDNKVICGLSGGVDSSVVAQLLSKAIGKNLTCIFVNNGLLRKNEETQVVNTFKNKLKMNLLYVNAEKEFIKKLKNVSDPEKKRKIIGATFVEVFEEEANKISDARFLAQGTLYPDVIESVSFTGGPSVMIKSHHNVGGLPERMNLELVEPLRELFKDEVRILGKELRLPREMVGRHPFPGPGLAIRIPGNVTKEKADILRAADRVYLEEIRNAGLYNEIWQAFAVLLPVQSVGVMGDARTYDYVCALRAVTSTDGMTADYYPFKHEFLGRTANRIINEVRGINRVVYDITSKPPGTIEWE
jgi:GMP synthase (glutamine-hydrolysing)